MLKPGLRIFFAAIMAAASLWAPAHPAPAQARGDFVSVQGGRLVFQGKPVKLKGVNFYPKDQPWGDMWVQWDGEAARQDLARAREIGANSIRVLVPYRPSSGWTDKATGQVKPVYLGELLQLVQ